MGKRFIDVNDSVIWRTLEHIREYKFPPRDGIQAATAFIAGEDSIIQRMWILIGQMDLRGS